MLKKYDMEVDFSDKFTYTPSGCKYCNNSGYFERIGIFEILTLTDDLKELIINGASSLEVRRQALKDGYRPLVVDGINKVLQGVTTLEEVNKKVILY